MGLISRAFSRSVYRAVRDADWMRPVPRALYWGEPSTVQPDLKLTYLGTAGFVIEAGGQVIVLDPYVTRPGLRRTLFRHLHPDPELIRRTIPRADDVLVGHAHHDHVLDAPELCKQTGARLIGSPAVCNVGRAAGLHESQLVQTCGREDIACGDAVVRGLPSQHGRVYFNRVGLPGDITEPPPWPPRVTDLRHGLVLNWFLEVAGIRVVHVDSADFFEQEWDGLSCDVLCLCAIGRQYRPHYVQDAVRLLRPRYVVPCHWDLFSTPIHDEPLMLPQVDLAGFLDEVRDAGAEPVLLPFFGEFGVKRATA